MYLKLNKYRSIAGLKHFWERGYNELFRLIRNCAVQLYSKRKEKQFTHHKHVLCSDTFCQHFISSRSSALLNRLIWNFDPFEGYERGKSPLLALWGTVTSPKFKPSHHHLIPFNDSKSNFGNCLITERVH